MTMEDDDFDRKWPEVKSAIDHMIDHLEARRSGTIYDQQMTSYRIVYELCTQIPRCNDDLYPTHRNKKRFYDVFGTEMDAYHQRYKADLVDPATGESKEGEPLLRSLLHRWRNFSSVKKFMVLTFNYVDIHAESNESLHDKAVASFQRFVYRPVAALVRAALLELISRERRGEVIESGLVGPCLGVLAALGKPADPLSVYRHDFKGGFLEATGRFYAREASSWASEDACTEFMRKAERRIAEEESRVGMYLPWETRAELIKVVSVSLLLEHGGKLVMMDNSGMRALLARGRDGYDDLRRMYGLFNRLEVLMEQTGEQAGDRGISLLVKIFREHIKDEGLALHEREERSTDKSSLATYVTQLLELHARFLEYVNECFDSNMRFSKALQEAFEGFMNRPLHGRGSAGAPSSSSSSSAAAKPLHPKTSTAELLALHADMLMRGGKEREAAGVVGDGALDNAMNRLVRLFSFIQEKDLFQEFYRKLLAKRLLLNRSESEDLERAMISKLKFEYGAAFTSKLEGMINDKNMTRELQHEFAQFVARDKPRVLANLHLDVQVLQMGHWPSYRVDALRLPSVFARGIEVYRKFYSDRTNSRRLEWVHSLSTVTMKATLGSPPASYDISMSLHIACVLMLFNTHESVKVDDMVKTLQLPFEEIRLAVASAAFGKQAILIKAAAPGTGDKKASKKKTVTASDVFEVNPAFKYKLKRFKIANAMSKMNEEEVATTQSSVESDRRYVIDAAIVRVMKSVKEISHQDLMTETIDQVKKYFTPKVSLIKIRIEDLIGRDYMKRKHGENSTYEYIA